MIFLNQYISDRPSIQEYIKMEHEKHARISQEIVRNARKVLADLARVKRVSEDAMLAMKEIVEIEKRELKTPMEEVLLLYLNKVKNI